MIYGNTTSFFSGSGSFPASLNRDTNRKTRPWNGTEAPGGGPAVPGCWKESMGLGQLLGFLWQKELQLLMLLPTRAGTVSSECSIEPGTGHCSGGVEAKAGVAAGRAPGQKRQEMLWAFRHCVIALFIWGEATQAALVPLMLKIAQWVLTSLPPPWAHRNSELAVSRALLFVHPSIGATGREGASFPAALAQTTDLQDLFSTCKQRKTLHLYNWM